MPNGKSSEQMRDEYLSRVTEFFNQAREWTSNFDAEATITEEDITIKEEPVGEYPAKVLAIIRPDRKTVRLLPRGCWIIGAEGRVDMKSDLGTETLVYTLERGPAIRLDLQTENGKILESGKPCPLAKDIAEGWALIQNRQLGMLPALDASLFCRLLEVLGQ